VHTESPFGVGSEGLPAQPTHQNIAAIELNFVPFIVTSGLNSRAVVRRALCETSASLFNIRCQRCSQFVRLYSGHAHARWPWYVGRWMPSPFQPFPMEGRRRAQAWRYQPQYRRPRHFHDQPELNVITSGTARFAIGTTELELRAGQVIGFVPGCEHELIAASADLELFALGYEPELVHAFVRDSGVALSFAGSPLALSDAELEAIRELCLSVDERSERLAIEQRLMSVAATLCSKERPMTLGWRAVDALAANPQCTREQLTRQLASNRGDLSRALRRDVGTSLPEYKNRLRILEFVRNLDRGLSMNTAARLGGFGSYSQCHRAFVQLLGHSPRDFVNSSTRWEVAQRFEPHDGAAVGRVANV
jgi:AraC-like DNA-binding protein/mannose-6-phosphate isomerase-like protein (cupin superfamily)